MKAVVRTVADAVGSGLLAGLVGTAAMTVSSTIEAKISGRGSSTTPADAAGKVAGVEPTGEDTQARFNNLVHWSYGTGWGAARGLLALAPLPGPVATLVHTGLVWASEQAILPMLDVGKPVWSYGAAAAGTDALHHAVYGAVTGTTYQWLDRG